MPDKSDHDKRSHPIKLLKQTARQADRPERRFFLPVHPRHVAPVRYAELCCKSNFSFLRGASHPEELVKRAFQMGYSALAVTDRNTLAGVVRMHCAAKACGLKLIIGAEITPVDAPPVTLYATDRAAYGRLARIITSGRLRSKKGSCSVTLRDIADANEGLIAVVQPDPEKPPGESYRDIFRNRIYLAACAHSGPDDAAHLARVHAGSCGLPTIATNDAHYHDPQRRFLHDVLTCVRERVTLDSAGRLLFANAERHLKTVEEMARLFAAYPQSLANTIKLADRCTFSLDELRYEYPEALSPPDRTPTTFLSQLTWKGAGKRYPHGLPDKVRRLIEHELALIEELNYEPYFLTVWDLVRFARSRGILCQGRGSAANSVVCYCLGITSVDPSQIELLFERFVSAERNEPPDIDVDFEHERREEVFQYIYEKYGRQHAGVVAEVITYRPRSAIRDIGKTLGLSLDHINALSKKHEWWDREALPDDLLKEIGFDPNDRTLRMLRKLVRQLIGFPRHLSQHVGGFVITRGPLCEMVPIENAAMPDRTFIEWDKDDIDALGILKIDCLALGMLTAIRKCFGLINTTEGKRLSLYSVPKEDPKVYRMICRADTVGVFQVESRAQMSMLPRLQPRCYYDLVIEIAIVRPGPIQGGMVHPYLRRRSGKEPITYPSEAVKGVLQRTLGVPLFQEQAMKLAIVAAGFTPGEADQLRRAMGAWRRNGSINRFQAKLISGMKANGLSEEFAQRCYKQICGFGEYGFPESHAASFAQLVYVSAWLKRYYPAAFCAAVINAQPMGFYQPAQLVRDAREHGVEVRPIDVNFSRYDCTLESDHSTSTLATRQGASESVDPTLWGRGGPSVRLGLRLIKGISRAKVACIETARKDGPFQSITDLARRSAATHATLARLAVADAMRSMGLDRRQALWEVLALGTGHSLLSELEPDETKPSLPKPTLQQIVVEDYDRTGLCLEAHPISLIRNDIQKLGILLASELKKQRHGKWAKVAGLVLIRQRPSTALGIIFCTLEDETGTANLVIRPPVYKQYRRPARAAVALLAEGRIERQGEVVHLQVSKMEDLTETLANLKTRSRDFH